MATVAELGLAALQDLGVYGAADDLNAEDGALCLSTLNRLVDQWATKRLLMFRVKRTTWTISSGDGSYTIGSGGTINVPWPAFIDHINFIDTSTDPDTEYPMTSLTSDAYAAITQKALESPFPAFWYFDRDYTASGLGNIELWPVPTSSTLTGVIYAANQVSEFSATSDTVALPPGYREMIVTSLAYRLASSFDRLDKMPALKELAQQALADVKTSNTRILDLSVDAGALPRGNVPIYDIYSDL